VVLGSFCIAVYMGGTLMFGLTAFFEPIAREFGWSYTEVSIAFCLRGLEMSIVAPIIGFFIDRFGVKRLTFLGVIMAGSAFILLSVTNSLAVLYSAFFLMAAGAGGCTGTSLMTAVANWFGRNVGKAMGIVSCGFGAGGVLIPLVVRLIDLYGWRSASVVLGLGMWTLGIPLSFVIGRKPRQCGLSFDGEISVGTSRAYGAGSKEASGFKAVLKGGNFWKIGIPEAIRAMITQAVVTHVMPYLSSVGVTRANAGFVATSIALFSTIGRFGFGWLGDIFDKRYVLAVAYCLLGLGVFAFSHIEVRWFILAFLLLFSPAQGGGASLRGAIIRDYFGTADFGKLLGIIMGVSAVGGMIGPFVAGWAFDNLDSYQPAWLSLAGSSVIAMVLILGIRTGSHVGKPRR